MPSRHSHRRRGVKRKTVEQRVNAKRATAHKHIPDRGEVDPHDGSTWDGIGKMKLKYRDLDNDNLATDAVDGRAVAANSIGDGHITGMDANKLQGNVPAAKLPVGTLIGRANSNTQIDWRNSSVPDGALVQSYAKAGELASIRQSISGMNNKIQSLSRKIQQLSQGRKKN